VRILVLLLLHNVGIVLIVSVLGHLELVALVHTLWRGGFVEGNSVLPVRMVNALLVHVLCHAPAVLGRPVLWLAIEGHGLGRDLYVRWSKCVSRRKLVIELHVNQYL